MRRAICVVLGLIVIFWTCSRVPSDSVLFDAQVRNTAGEPLTTGHVLVYDGENGRLLGFKMFKKGRVRIAISNPSGETRYVEVVAPYYQHLGFPFIVDSVTSTVRGTVVLASNVRKDANHVEVTIGGNTFDMERQPDGSFTYRFDEVTGEAVSYNLKGASVDGDRLPGSQRDRLSFTAEDGPPFYWAVIERPLRPVELVYAPPEIPEPDPPGSASRLATSSNTTLKTALEIAQELDHALSEYGRRIRNGEQPERREVMARLFALAMSGLASEIDELRQYSAAIVMDGSLGDVATDEERALAAEALPLQSPYWAWVRGLRSLPPERLGPRGFEIFDSLARENADRRVRAFAVAALANAAKKAEDTTTWVERYQQLERFVDLGEPILYLLKRLDPNTKIVVGKPVPSFNLPLFDGTYRGSDFISDESLSGVAYVLVFWGTWCPPCVVAMPDLQSLWQQYGGPEFQVMSLSVGDTAESVQRFRKELWSMPWLHVVLEGDLEQRVLDHFEVTSYPTTILVDLDGTIVSLKDADEGLDEAVADLSARGVSTLVRE